MRKWGFGVLASALVVLAGVAFIGRTSEPEELDASAFEAAALRLVVDVSDRRLRVEKDGSVIRTYGVAVGTAKHPTPKGNFAVRRIIWNPRWVPPDSEWAKNEKPREPGDPKNPMGRVKIFFREPTYYLHGTNAAASIGRAASHGCIRMRNGDIIELSQLLVQHAGANVEPGVIQRLINRVRQTREVRLNRPVPLRVQA